MTTATAEFPVPAGTPDPTRRHRSGWRQLGIDTGFVLVGFPLSIAAFVPGSPGCRSASARW